jgi:hypothetical protein
MYLLIFYFRLHIHEVEVDSIHSLVEVCSFFIFIYCFNTNNIVIFIFLQEICSFFS